MFAPHWRARLLVASVLEGLSITALVLLMTRGVQRTCRSRRPTGVGGNGETRPLINETPAGERTQSHRHGNGAESYSHEREGGRPPNSLEAGLVGQRFRSTRTLHAALCATAAARHWCFLGGHLLLGAVTFGLCVAFNGPLLLTVPSACITLLWSLVVTGIGLRRLYVSLVWTQALSWLLTLPAFGALGAHAGGWEVTLATSLFLCGLFSPCCHIQLPTEGALPVGGAAGATTTVSGGALRVLVFAGSRTTRIDTRTTTTVITHANSFSSSTRSSGVAVVASCTAVAARGGGPGTSPLYEVTDVTIATADRSTGYRESNA